jgi:hypothetical protein
MSTVAPPDAVPPPGALPVTVMLNGNPVHIGWVLTLADLPDLLEAVANKIRTITVEAARDHTGP